MLIFEPSVLLAMPCFLLGLVLNSNECFDGIT